MTKRQRKGGRVTPRGGYTVTYSADGRSEQCVFCELIVLAHHIETYVVPTIPDETTRDQARLLVGSVRTNANDLSRLIRH
jgi:hypothetical protein